MAELFDILGKGSLKLSGPTSLPINDTTFTLIPMDELVVERGSFDVDPAAGTITVTKDGLYEVKSGVDVAFPGTEELQLMIFVNGNPADPDNMAIQGRGNNRPVSLFWAVTTQLSAGDVVDIRAINGDSGNTTLNFIRCKLSVENDG